MKLRRFKRGERGNAMLELAICVPAFLLLVMGAMDFSWGVYAYNFCAYGAQDAARQASVHGSKSTSAWGYSDVTSFVQSEAVGLTTSQLTVTPCWSGTCLTTGSPASGTNDPGDTIQVTVQYKIQPLTGLGFKGPITVSSTAQYVINR